MAIQVTTAVRGFLRGLVGMEGESLKGILEFYSNTQNLSVADLESALAEVVKTDAKSIEKDRKRAENAAHKVEDERVRRLILSASTLDEVRQHLPYVIIRNKEVYVTLQGFDTNLRASRQGNKSGKGRPKKDAPTGFQAVDTGEEILGGMSTFVKEQMEADAFSGVVIVTVDENDNESTQSLVAALFTNGGSGNMRSKEKVTEALLAAGVIMLVDSSEENSEKSDDEDSPSDTDA